MTANEKLPVGSGVQEPLLTPAPAGPASLAVGDLLSAILSHALACVEACAVAYDAEPTIETPLSHVLIVDDHPEFRIIAFRGSKSVLDWFVDGECFRSDFGTGKQEVHHGFKDAIQSILPQLVDHLSTLDPRPTLIAGHSKGGAEAILCAEMLQVRNFVRSEPDNILGVYTFGQPRVGNHAFARMYDAVLRSRTFRFVYQQDIVPRIPHLPRLLDPYWHCGREVLISKDFRLIIDPPFRQLLFNDISAIYRDWRAGDIDSFAELLQDHHIGNYLGALRRAELCEAPSLTT